MINDDEWNRNTEAYSAFVERKVKEELATWVWNYDNYIGFDGKTHCGRPHGDPTHIMNCVCIGSW